MVTQVDFDLRIVGLLLFAVFVKAVEGHLRNAVVSLCS